MWFKKFDWYIILWVQQLGIISSNNVNVNINKWALKHIMRDEYIWFKSWFKMILFDNKLILDTRTRIEIW